MKKILIIGLSHMIGGVEIYTYNFAKYMNRDMYDADFLIIGDEYPSIYAKEINALWGDNREHLFYCPNLKRHYWKGRKWLKNFYKKNKYDYIYMNTCTAARISYCKYPLKKRQTKLITHSHNGSSLSYFNHIIFRSYTTRKSNYLLACSDIAAKWMFGKRAKEAAIIPNGIDLEKFRFNESYKNYIRNKYSISDEDIVLGHIGRFEYQKNHSFLIKLAKVLELKYKFMLIGDGTLKEEFINSVKNENLEDRFIILPSTDEVDKYYSAMDILVLPSRYEGLPLVAVEAQANGLNCLLSDNISTQTNITGKCFYLSIDDTLAWRDKLIELKMSRYDGIDILNKSGYSIKNTVELVEKNFE